MSIFCRHKWKFNVKKFFILCSESDSESDSYSGIQCHMQFMCEKCYKFESKTYYICYGNFEAQSYVIISENWNDIKKITNEQLITIFNDRQVMINTVCADLKYQSFINKLQKKYGIIID